MTALSVHRLSKYFGDRCLFDKITFEVSEHDKIGLVGVNGCGKSTLFRILMNAETADEGEVLTAKNTRLGYLEQHTLQDSDMTVWEAVESVFEPLRRMERELADINRQLSAGENAALIEKQHLLQEELEARGGLYYKSRVGSTLTGLGFDESVFQQPVSTLSGGQRSKIAMGRLLLSDANLLLLDEPTNHLDIAAVEWLEGFLRAYTGAVIVISHDRYFLDRVTTRTMEIAHRTLYCTNGNYSAHREKREKDAEIARHHYKSTEKAIKKLEENIALLKQWNREKSVRAAESREKRLERMKEQQERPEEAQSTIRFGFSAATVSGNEVLSVGELAMGFGDNLFTDVNFQLRRGERVFLLGPNGCGKTTLLRLITGELQPRGGYIRLGAKVSLGYYDQIQADLDPEKTAIEQLWDTYPKLTETELRNALAAFLFRGDEVFKPVAQLSGGEKARLLLLKLMLAHDNLLLLDEPTNHLDIASREALEDALTGYEGTLFIVSHDRYFINRMANRILHLEETGCTSYLGNYDAYAEQRATLASPAVVQATAPARENAYQKRKEHESLKRKTATRVRRCEESIAACEEDIADLHAQLEQPDIAAQYDRVLELSTQLDTKNAELEALMDEWEQAQALLEELEQA
ncbi:MAG: ABC-F family ATP-binding cassette domain-containing protein [Clostridia bacterium]|nr:ABC-F family ATP-binding cassette domain-containing protein [Clostridia bacterium]